MKNIFMKICAFFLRRLAIIYNNYDVMKEPKRFYVAMGFGMGPFLLLELLAVITNNKGFEISAWVWILLMIGLRFWWVKGQLYLWLPGTHEHHYLHFK